MKNSALQLWLLAYSFFLCSSGQFLCSANAGECSKCKGPYGGKTSPCGDTGCGPRYWGALCDEPFHPDPCNCRNKWTGGCSQSPSLDLTRTMADDLQGKGFGHQSSAAMQLRAPVKPVAHMAGLIFGNPDAALHETVQWQAVRSNSRTKFPAHCF